MRYNLKTEKNGPLKTEKKRTLNNIILKIYLLPLVLKLLCPVAKTLSRDFW